MSDLHDDLRTYFDELARRAEADVAAGDPSGDDGGPGRPAAVAAGGSPRPPGSPGWSGSSESGPVRRRRSAGAVALVAVGAVLVLVAAGALVLVARSSGHPATRTVIAAGPTSVPPSPGYTLVVSPTQDLTDGQTVHIHATGFAPGSEAGIATCDGYNLEGGLSVTPFCDLGGLEQVAADIQGVVDTSYTVRRVIDVNGPFDSATEPQGCDVAVGPMSQSVTAPSVGAGQRVTFAPGPAAPLPAITLAPIGDFHDGQIVTVTGTHFAAGSQVYVAECPPDTDCTGPTFGVDVQADANGGFQAQLTLHRSFTVAANEPDATNGQITLTCLTGCDIRASSSSNPPRSAIPIPFVLTTG